jgi:cysteine synthase
MVELTSGNTGTGLAIVCSVIGHPFVAVMSSGNSPERAQMMRAIGAEVVLVDQKEGSRMGHVSGDDLALVEEAAAWVGRMRRVWSRPDSAIAPRRCRVDGYHRQVR